MKVFLIEFRKNGGDWQKLSTRTADGANSIQVFTKEQKALDILEEFKSAYKNDGMEFRKVEDELVKAEK